MPERSEGEPQLEPIPSLRGYQRVALRTVQAALHPTRPQCLHIGTGGGKTAVAATVAADVIRAGGRVLWLAFQWELLTQAAATFAHWHRDLRDQIARSGGGADALPGVPAHTAQSLLLSTVYTTRNRIRAGQAEPVDLVIMDECHHGDDCPMADEILSWARASRTRVLGLTATPKDPSCSAYQVAYSLGFSELVARGQLLPPLLVPVELYSSWRPEFGATDVGSDSRRALAQDVPRNRRIARYLLEHRHTLGQTLLFACNREHALALSALLNAEEGIPARALIGSQSQSERARHLEAFRRGDVQVLVSVDLLVMGVDLPMTRTVAIARPTGSATRFAQMVGRGARRSGDMDHFNVVEFAVDLARHRDLLIAGPRFFGAGRFPQSHQPSRRLVRFEAEPSITLANIAPRADVPRALHGLVYDEHQDFGIELELCRRGSQPDSAGWMAGAGTLRQALVAAVGAERVCSRAIRHYGQADYTRWCITPDASVTWEITSPVLRGRAGLEEAQRVCQALEDLVEADVRHGFHINHKCGFHLHLAMPEPHALADIQRLVALWRVFEPGLATLVAPSRIAGWSRTGYRVGEANRYCRPVGIVAPAAVLDGLSNLRGLRSWLSEDVSRFSTLNLVSLLDKGTVEVRLHSGTVSPDKVLLWTSLAMQILWAARRDRTVPAESDVASLSPTGDIVALAQRWLPPEPTGVYLDRLHQRRLEIRRLWTRHGLDGWAEAAQAWTAPTPPQAPTLQEVAVDAPELTAQALARRPRPSGGGMATRRLQLNSHALGGLNATLA